MSGTKCLFAEALTGEWPSSHSSRCRPGAAADTHDPFRDFDVGRISEGRTKRVQQRTEMARESSVSSTVKCHLTSQNTNLT